MLCFHWYLHVSKYFKGVLQRCFIVFKGVLIVSRMFRSVQGCFIGFKDVSVFQGYFKYFDGVSKKYKINFLY